MNTTAVISEGKSAQLVVEPIREDLQGFSSELAAVWGGLFPYGVAYLVLSKFDFTVAYRLYPLGVCTHDLSSVAYSQKIVGLGMIDRQTLQRRIPTVSDERRLGLLSIYRKERLGSVFT